MDPATEEKSRNRSVIDVALGAQESAFLIAPISPISIGNKVTAENGNGEEVLEI